MENKYNFKTFGQLQIGDQMYCYTKMKVIPYTIINIENKEEVSTSWTYHKEIIKSNRYRIIKYINSKGQEYTLEFNDTPNYRINSELEDFQRKNYSGEIFSDRNAVIKYVTDLFDYRKQKLKKLQIQYDKERDYIEKYKECLKNLPE
jgi:hypothetical protein